MGRPVLAFLSTFWRFYIAGAQSANLALNTAAFCSLSRQSGVLKHISPVELSAAFKEG